MNQLQYNQLMKTQFLELFNLMPGRLTKLVLITLVVIFCAGLSNIINNGQFHTVWAQNQTNFHTELTSTYTVDQAGQTRVQHSFKIRNLTPEYYINRYSLKLNTESISSISVVSGEEVITPEVNQARGVTEIEIEFPDKVVGQDRVRQFTITYTNPAIAEINGQVLEVHIPSMQSQDDYDQHQVVLITPLIYGHPSFIKPENYHIRQQDQNFVLTYDQISQGVSAIFGSEQIFNLNIRYHLSNTNNQPAITQVSLPPDTPYQKIFYHQLDPKPQEIETDSDGNWIATYYLPANDVVEVEIEATTLISLEQIQPWLNIEPTEHHTASQVYWETQHSTIQELAAQYQQPSEIYQYVINNLQYRQDDLTEKIDRFGAVKALEQPQQATCQEFSDVYIALARANQIPTRRATGYAHSNDPNLQPLGLVTDVLHAWLEYYDYQQQKWIPIDPTWGSTMQGVDYFNQFDLKHIVFAYNGKSSRYPLAAGDYKLPNQTSKDLEVSFEQEFPEADPNFEISVKPQKLLGLINLPSRYQLSIENLTGRAWYNNRLQLLSNQEQTTIDQTEFEFTLLPWQEKNIPIRVFNDTHWLPGLDHIQLTMTQQDYHHEETIELSTIKPILDQPQKTIQDWLQSIPAELSSDKLKIGLGIFTGVFALAAGYLLVFKRRQ